MRSNLNSFCNVWQLYHSQPSEALDPWVGSQAHQETKNGNARTTWREPNWNGEGSTQRRWLGHSVGAWFVLWDDVMKQVVLSHILFLIQKPAHHPRSGGKDLKNSAAYPPSFGARLVQLHCQWVVSWCKRVYLDCGTLILFKHILKHIYTNK